MNRIRVVDVVGRWGITGEDGEKLRGVIRESLDRGDTVLLDFSGVAEIAAPFSMAGIGALYGFYPREDLDARLRWEGLHPASEAYLQVVRDKAIFFYSATPAQQQALLQLSDPTRWD
jgi:hypothetical protein